MKGVTVLTDEMNKKKILQADIKEVVKNPQQFEDFLDVLIAEYRNEEKKISRDRAKKQLKKSGKVKF
jgi:deoxycytidylate deaminase